jgi:hypothetical protein
MTRKPRTDPPHTPHQLMLSIGGLVGHLELRGAQPVFLEQLRARYGAFEMPAAARVERDFSLCLTFDPAAAPGPAARRLAKTEANPLEVVARARAIVAERWDFKVRLSGRSGRGGRVSYRGEGRCEMSPFALDCVLRVLYATLLPRVGGMLIHGCGLRHAAIGVVFPGQSGAGKTTLARKAPDADDVLSDEIVAVRQVDDGWRVFGTPFWGDFARGGISMRSWPLRTLAFLAQSPREVAMTPIMSSDATLRLLGCFLAFATDRASVERSLAVAVALCAAVRSVEASLTRVAPTAVIFRRLGPHLGPEVTRKVPPSSARELISEFRALLRKQKSYAFRPKQATPWLHAGDSLVVEGAGGARPTVAGDILLSWMPGATPDEDALAFTRLPATGANRAEVEGELLGRVALISRQGKTLPLPARIGDLARSFGPLVALPMLRMAGR